MAGGQLPIHREAYPQIAVSSLIKAWDAGELCCEFFDGRGYRIGDLAVEALRDDDVLVSWNVRHNHVLQSGRGPLDYQVRETGVGAQRVYLVCPGCLARKTKLYLVANSWHCADCHNLTYQSQLLTSDQRKTNRLGELETLVRSGRPKHMRQARYNSLLEEWKSLRKGPRARPIMNNVHAAHVRSEWRSFEDISPAFRTDFEPGPHGLCRVPSFVPGSHGSLRGGVEPGRTRPAEAPVLRASPWLDNDGDFSTDVASRSPD